jgi:hypothetical protein
MNTSTDDCIIFAVFGPGFFSKDYVLISDVRETSRRFLIGCRWSRADAEDSCSGPRRASDP